MTERFEERVRSLQKENELLYGKFSESSNARATACRKSP
jgi:hypothetical protein